MIVVMIGHLELRHLVEVVADRLGLAALFGIDSGVRTGRIDERKQRQTKLLGKLHQAQCLAIALGLAHAEVAQRALFRVATFLVTEQHHRLPIEARHAADDRQVVRE